MTKAEALPKVSERHVDHAVAVADGQLHTATRVAVCEDAVHRQEAPVLVHDLLVVDVGQEEAGVVVGVVGYEEDFLSAQPCDGLEHR